MVRVIVKYNLKECCILYNLFKLVDSGNLSKQVSFAVFKEKILALGKLQFNINYDIIRSPRLFLDSRNKNFMGDGKMFLLLRD